MSELDNPTIQGDYVVESCECGSDQLFKNVVDHGFIDFKGDFHRNPKERITKGFECVGCGKKLDYELKEARNNGD